MKPINKVKKYNVKKSALRSHETGELSSHTIILEAHLNKDCSQQDGCMSRAVNLEEH